MKVLLVHNYLASFVKTDIDLLASAHDLRVHHLRFRPGQVPGAVVAMHRDVAWSDVVVSWFGGAHAFVAGNLAKRLKKPHLIIASGYDVSNLPEIAYGNMRPGLMRYVGRMAFRLATRILPVSRFTESELRANVPLPPSTPVNVVHHGFVDMGISAQTRKPNSVVMIASLNRDVQIRKGIGTYIEAARRLPQVEFALVGKATDGSLETLRAAAPSNLNVTGFVEDVSVWLRQSKAYAQLSRHEAFGCGLAEAMVEGCVPVVTDCAALPEVAGDTGFYAQFGDVASTICAIQQALASPSEQGLRARARILTEFPLERRRQKLLAALEAARASS